MDLVTGRNVPSFINAFIPNKHRYDDVKIALKNDHYLTSRLNSDRKWYWDEYDENNKLVNSYPYKKIKISLMNINDKGYFVGHTQ